MNIINNVRSYILESDTKITIVNNIISIVNYIDIVSFDTDKIIVKLDKRNIIIKGSNLVISKMMLDEIVINGEFYNIEFR